MPKASAATLFAGSATQVVYQGQTFVIDWYLDTEGIPINSLDLKIGFSSETLRVIDASAGNSIVSLWIRPPSFDQSRGRIELTGGVPGGVNGSSVPVFRTTFEAVNAGNAKITMLEDSVILRNDGRGTAEALKFRPIEFPVVDESLMPQVVSSPTHPDQSKWYSLDRVVIRFDVRPGLDYSYIFTSNAELYPDERADEVGGEVVYENLPDGIYYFKLNSKTGPSNWQEAAVFRVQIDKTPPEIFTPLIDSDPAVLGGNKFLSFSTVDKTSGISHYYIKSGLLGFWKEARSPHKLGRPLVGNTVKVAAFDRAGNKRVETIEYQGIVTVWLFWILLLAAAGSISYLIQRFLKNKHNVF